MNQSQIRAVKECLDPHFKEAITELTTRRNEAVNKAVGEAAEKIFKNHDIYRSSVVDCLKAIQTAVRSAEKVGIYLRCNTNGLYLERVDTPQPLNVTVELTDEKEHELKARFGATFDAKIETVKTLQRSTYLSLHDSTTLKLGPLVENVVAQIRKVLA